MIDRSCQIGASGASALWGSLDVGSWGEIAVGEEDDKSLFVSGFPDGWNVSFDGFDIGFVDELVDESGEGALRAT